ncbi:hypothetical protein MMC07_006231 [Pseudocyphellaria aurata]|nr:hypothetical protein [Pseudocyphellaria aurata]
MDSIRQAIDQLIQYLLVHVESPEKLREVELESPQICVEDGEIWLKFIKRDIPGWEQKKHRPEGPVAPDDWYKLYWSLQAEIRREIEADEKVLVTDLLRLKNESERHRSRHVHPSEVPPLPKMGAMKLIKTPKKKKISSSLVATKPDRLIFSVGSKVKARSGEEFLKNARCQIKEHQSFFGPNGNLSRPTHTLAAQSTQIKTAPRSLVHDYRNPTWKPHDPSVKPPEIFLPKRKRVEPDKSFTSDQSTTAEKQSGLCAKTISAKNKASSNCSAEQPRVVAQKRKRAESDELTDASSPPIDLAKVKPQQPQEKRQTKTFRKSHLKANVAYKYLAFFLSSSHHRAGIYRVLPFAAIQKLRGIKQVTISGATEQKYRDEVTGVISRTAKGGIVQTFRELAKGARAIRTKRWEDAIDIAEEQTDDYMLVFYSRSEGTSGLSMNSFSTCKAAEELVSATTKNIRQITRLLRQRSDTVCLTSSDTIQCAPAPAPTS